MPREIDLRQIPRDPRVIMSDELWDTLLKFHREVAMPSIVTEIAGPIREEIAALDRKMEGDCDGVYQRLDRLDTLSKEMRVTLERIAAR